MPRTLAHGTPAAARPNDFIFSAIEILSRGDGLFTLCRYHQVNFEVLGIPIFTDCYRPQLRLYSLTFRRRNTFTSLTVLASDFRFMFA